MLGDLILGYLTFLEENDPQTLDMVVGAYNNSIKARSVDDDDFFDRICDLVRMTTSEGNMSMKTYLAQAKGAIYYFSERGTGTQHKLSFAHKNLPVIDASWGMEEEFLEKCAQRKKVQLERLEAGSGLIFQEAETVDEKWCFWQVKKSPNGRQKCRHLRINIGLTAVKNITSRKRLALSGRGPIPARFGRQQRAHLAQMRRSEPFCFTGVSVV